MKWPQNWHNWTKRWFSLIQVIHTHRNVPSHFLFCKFRIWTEQSKILSLKFYVLMLKACLKLSRSSLEVTRGQNKKKPRKTLDNSPSCLQNWSNLCQNIFSSCLNFQPLESHQWKKIPFWHKKCVKSTRKNGALTTHCSQPLSQYWFSYGRCQTASGPDGFFRDLVVVVL